MEYECLDIEKREESGYPGFQSPLEAAVGEMERMENAAEDLGSKARGVWRRLTIRMEDIERPYSKQNYLR
jgi:hypothetical protein